MRGVLALLLDDRYNPQAGSLTIERLQNLAFQWFPVAYRAVMQRRRGGTEAPSSRSRRPRKVFRRFLDAHPDRLGVWEDPATGLQHVFRRDEACWLENDRRARLERRSREAWVLRCLWEHVADVPESSLDAFRAAHPSPPVPARGDLVRLLRRRSDLFWFDGRRYVYGRSEPHPNRFDAPRC